MLLRLIIWGLLIYFFLKFVNNIVNMIFGNSAERKSEVRGRQKESDLNLNKEDIEDADFEELK